MALPAEPGGEPPAGVARLPTLTEVVELGVADPPAASAEATAPDAGALVDAVLAELAPRIDMLLESRLRERLAPALARAADGLIRDARDGLTTTLRELVDEAVARALKRRAGR